jgi:hypothetical protein
MVALVVGQCPTEVTTLDARNPRSGYPGRGFRRFGGGQGGGGTERERYSSGERVGRGFQK